MTVKSPHPERHLIHRVGWLRAAVLGANDGIVSTASLITGVAAASVSKESVLIAGVAGLVAGAMSMAAGEYVSVSSQKDTERADLEIEKRALKTMPAAELNELTEIYRQRGLDKELARQVALQLTAKNALDAHKRDELGITDVASARPVQAAASSATSFAIGACLPLAAAAIAPLSSALFAVPAASLIALALLGLASAKAGGARPIAAVVRVTFWGAAAMALTALVGRLFGAAV